MRICGNQGVLRSSNQKAKPEFSSLTFLLGLEEKGRLGSVDECVNTFSP